MTQRDGHRAARGRGTPRAGRRVPANSGRVVGDRPAHRAEPLREDPYRRPSRTSDARWLPPNDEPTEKFQGRRDTKRPLLTSGKLALTVVSVLVLVITGYYWGELKPWQEGLTTRDVIDQAPTEKPADGAVDILMVGMDARTDAQGHPLSQKQLAALHAGSSDGELNTDTLILIRIPNDGKPAVGLSLPRDSYVDIPGFGQHKINSAYARAKNDEYQKLQDQGVKDKAKLEVRANQAGAKNLIATIQQLTGATIDHYAEVNLLGFSDITKAVGGIDVCLKHRVDDDYSGAHFRAGKQNLSGVPALAFVRQRHGLPNGDLDRIVRQQVFMSGMAKKVFSKDMLSPGSDTLDKLRVAVQKSVVLDQDWNVIQFAQQMMTFTGGKLSFKTIPVGRPDLETPEDGSAVEVDPNKVRTFVESLLGKKPAPQRGGGDKQAAGADDASNQQVTVNVRNASGQGGLARTVADSLTQKGFARGDVGNADLRNTTVVRYANGEEAAGQRVAQAIGGNPNVETDTNLPAGSVTVLLGADYDATQASGQGLAHKPLLNLAPGKSQTDKSGCVN